MEGTGTAQMGARSDSAKLGSLDRLKCLDTGMLGAGLKTCPL